MRPERVVDTTGAGDSFSGAYLSGRLLGLEPAAAVRLGHAVASQVVGVRGALAKIDRDAAFRSAGLNPDYVALGEGAGIYDSPSS
jgi:sugar/nucleoside kinase (ribokinase family)